MIGLANPEVDKTLAVLFASFSSEDRARLKKLGGEAGDAMARFLNALLESLGPQAATNEQTMQAHGMVFMLRDMFASGTLVNLLDAPPNGE